MPSPRIIFGCGYLGFRVARLWLAGGDRVAAVTRSAERAVELERHGIAAIVADVTKPSTLTDLPPSESVLFAVGFDRAACGDIHSVYAGGVRHVLDALPGAAERFLYISSTGVYGSADGDWVDEQTPPDPQRDGGRASLAAEQAIATHGAGRRGAILRMGGLYGPGRVPHLDRLAAAEPIPAPSKGWLNLVHIDDAARIVVAADEWLAARRGDDGPHVFCVTDGTPVLRGDYYREAARVLSAAPPRFAPPPADSPAAARAGANRRVCSDTLRRTLGVKLAFPTYREGLAAILVAS